MVQEEKLVEFINTIKNDYELKEIMKEKYYEMKIKEAKIIKNIPIFNWDALPIEITDIIMDFKFQKDFKYIKEIFKEKDLTMKSFQEWIFRWKNENGSKIQQLPSWNNRNIVQYFTAIINKKCIYETINKYNPNGSLILNKEGIHPIYYRNIQPKTIRILENYKAITKNKTPSFEEYIDWRMDQKKIENLQRAKKSQETRAANLEKINKYNIGDIIYEYRWSSDFYRIIGETKTQYRVMKIDSKIVEVDRGPSGIGGMRRKYIYHLFDKNLDNMTNTKSKNIGKRSEYYRVKTVEEFIRKRYRSGNQEYLLRIEEWVGNIHEYSSLW